ncbi:MAG: T9SS type A sorting domain-containing protein, partial [Chlorobi bacterium]|nr:T9SS type A sorting domain-containing protein [Chlorobiota bacterium]
KVRVYYSTGSGYTAVELSNTGGNTWSGNIPGLPAGSFVDYYIEAQETWGSKLAYPAGAPSNHLSFLVGFQQAFFHDFESDQNWKGGVQGDDALTGRWIRAVPIQTFVSTQPVQPGADHTASGNKCYVTGNGTPGGQPGENDVDEGKTTLESPVFDASNYNVPVIRYWRWFSNDLGAAPGNDPWVVQISSDGGSNWVDLENTKAAMNAWIPRTFKIGDYVTPTANMKLRFIARDQDPQSLVEAAVDDVELLYVTIVPVELESFRAVRSGKGALLQWVTAAETNNFGFEIQYRLPDDDWQQAGFIPGAGTTTEPRQYTYTIPYAPVRDFLVRLKQIDFDGAYELLPERLVPASGAQTKLMPGYPNPVTGGVDAVTLRYFLSEPGLVRIEILDLLGRTRKIVLDGEAAGGYHDVPVNLAGFSSGTYMVRMTSKEGSFQQILEIFR